MDVQSPLQKSRLNYQPKLPRILENLNEVTAKPQIQKNSAVTPTIDALFPYIHKNPLLNIVKGTKNLTGPLRVGVVLSGGQAPGGHNVISGLFDALKELNLKSMLFGFCNGPSGIINNKYIEITQSLLANYRNQGGFDLIGSGRTKIETQDQFLAVKNVVDQLNLDGLVIIGGDDSNTNAALLAEYFVSNNSKTAVVGVPKTIDGDLKNKDIEISFGFDTASKTYANIIGDLMRDALSAKKYYYFIKLMGRSASHITLECALQTHPNLALISEEVASERNTLGDLIKIICDLVCDRALHGKEYGIILIPEGVIEFIPEVKSLIQELNGLLSKEKSHDAILEAINNKEEKIAYAGKLLSKESLNCFQTLPKDIQVQLLLGRDAHGNVQVSKIETERMLIELVKKELEGRAKKGTFKGKFNPQPHFCGYEGRSCFPTNFDSQYCYALGRVAALLVESKATGYICSIKKLTQKVEEWEAAGIPLTSMMTIEQRHGENKPVIQKALVDLKGKPFGTFSKTRTQWVIEDDYVYPGPVQFFGPPELCDTITMTLELETHLTQKE